MYFSDSITLRTVAYTLDSFGDQVPSNTDTVVFADRKSVKRSEFYTASMAGVKIDTVFAVHVEDYDDQTVVVDGTKIYTVVRSYQNGEGTVELMCAGR